MSSSFRRIVVNTAKAPSALGPYNQAIVADKTMFISGQLGLDPETMEFVPGGATAEARKALENMGEILKYEHLTNTVLLMVKK